MKVLVISHNVFSENQNMGQTLLSLFSDFKKNEICQLYIYPTAPELDNCNSYYRITDKDIIKGFFRRKNIGGKISVVSKGKNIHSLYEKESDISFYTYSKKSTSGIRLLRDFIWKLSPWYSRELRKWVEEEIPTCIFLAPGYAKFIYDIALKISKDYKLPIITYICDDYYFVNKPNNILANLQIGLLKNKIENLLKKTKHLVAISDEIATLYEKKFRLPSTVIMTGTNVGIAKHSNVKENPNTISYYGNIGCNRYISLCEVGKCIDEINKEEKTEYKIRIYTSEMSNRILNTFRGIAAIEVCGFLSGEDFKDVFASSELLLHIEAFDDESVDITKNSISTKIADSLASGIPLIAYGPQNIASIKYLKKNKCAHIISRNLKDDIKEVFRNREKSEEVVLNALKAAKENHDVVLNSKILRGIIEEAND